MHQIRGRKAPVAGTNRSVYSPFSKFNLTQVVEIRSGGSGRVQVPVSKHLTLSTFSTPTESEQIRLVRTPGFREIANASGASQDARALA